MKRLSPQLRHLERVARRLDRKGFHGLAAELRDAIEAQRLQRADRPVTS